MVEVDGSPYLVFEYSTGEIRSCEHTLQHLGRQQAKMLRCLLMNRDRTVRHVQLLHEISPESDASPDDLGLRNVRSTVCLIRKKLDEIIPGLGNHIKNVKGVGYKWDSQE